MVETLIGQWWFPLIVLVPLAAVLLIFWVLDKVQSPTRAILNALVVGAAALAARFVLHWSWAHVGDVALAMCAIWVAFWLFERWENELVEKAAAASRGTSGRTRTNENQRAMTRAHSLAGFRHPADC